MATIVRPEQPSDHFAIIANGALEDERLSFRARGLLAYLISRPPGWKTDSTKLAALTIEGRDAVRTALRELEARGYLQRQKVQGERGRFSTVTVVHQYPIESETPE
jgi:hypothetical protein